MHTLPASLLGGWLSGKGIVRASEETISISIVCSKCGDEYKKNIQRKINWNIKNCWFNS